MSMSDIPQRPGVDRREFLNGEWPKSSAEREARTAGMASVLVQVRPERMDAAARAIEALPGAEIYTRDPRGKLVVVLEASTVGMIGSTLNTISLMPDVLTAALVFHGTDEG